MPKEQLEKELQNLKAHREILLKEKDGLNGRQIEKF